MGEVRPQKSVGPSGMGRARSRPSLTHSQEEIVNQRRPKKRSKPRMAGFADIDEPFMKMLEAFLRPQSAPQLSIEQVPRSAKFRKKGAAD
jgi:hypothetical protein